MEKKESINNKIINRNLTTLHLYNPFFFYQYAQKSVKIKNKIKIHNNDNTYMFSKLFTKNTNRKYILKKIINQITNCNNFNILLRNFLINKNNIIYINFDMSNNINIINFLQTLQQQRKKNPFYAIVFFKNHCIKSKDVFSLKKKHTCTKSLLLNFQKLTFLFYSLLNIHLKLFFVLINVLQLHNYSVENTTL